MAIALDAASWNDGAATTQTVGMDITSAGMTLGLLVCTDRARTINSVSDTGSHTFGLKATLDDTTQWKSRLYVAENCTAQAGNTLSVTLDASSTGFLLVAFRLSGNAAAAFDKIASQFLGSPGTGANGVTSGATATLTTQPQLVVGFALPNGSPNTSLAVGTGFTSALTGTTAFSGVFRLEYQRVTSTTGIAATFTAGANVGHSAIVATFIEAGASASVSDVNYQARNRGIARGIARGVKFVQHVNGLFLPCKPRIFLPA